MGDGWALLHIDRHLLHDLSGPPAMAEVAARGLSLHNPELDFATPDHAASSQPGRTPGTYPLGGRLHGALRDLSAKAYTLLWVELDETMSVTRVWRRDT